ncbi:MAG: zinc ribbon domain-containing protein [Roseburia sp.]|nr:zinc ribbon domain-containing protein [Anaeroplasma bactoclasticum]MCM1196517.1 zinc ribbon domain-containing protein [Roseburia sp.]MCM1557251.1 zinc ribbon domain-containing protein [Anaeroplasma bactoclasticum]
MKYNFCPNCGFKLEENFKFCPNCGLEFGGTEQPRQTTPTGEHEYSRQPQQTTTSDVDKAKALFRNKDYTMALSYLIDYANSNDMEILYMIGYCLYATKKFDPNCEKFLKLAADLGHPLAQAALGELYYALAEECSQGNFDEETKSKCELYYSLALKYLNLAKGNGVK